MMLSVALCTYNGAQFIRAQIESILRQTLPVDEIVVCDDGSTDNTLQIIESFCQETPTKIRIYRNETNLGVCANFQKAVNLCNGDIIFLSDQDDVWYPNKVEVIFRWFEENPDKCVVFSNADLIDMNGEPIAGKTCFDSVGFTETTQKHFAEGFQLEIFSKINRATGATMAIKSDHHRYNTLLNIYNNSDIQNSRLLHDSFYANLAASEGKLGFIPSSLMQYRIHNSQSMGLPPIENPYIDKGCIFNFRRYFSKYEQFDQWGEKYTSKLKFIQFRQNSSLYCKIRNYRCYKKIYSKKWRTALLYDIYHRFRHIWLTTNNSY